MAGAVLILNNCSFRSLTSKMDVVLALLNSQLSNQNFMSSPTVPTHTNKAPVPPFKNECVRMCCMCVHTQTAGCAHGCLCPWRLEIDGGCLQSPPPSLLRQSHSLNLELTDWAKLAGQRVRGILPLPPPWHQVLCEHHCESWDLNSAPWACTTDAIPTELLAAFVLLCFVLNEKFLM